MREQTARRLMALILVLFVSLGFSYACTTPTLEAPDENHHYDYIRSLINTGLPPELEQGGGKGFGHHAPLYYAVGALSSFWVGEGDLDVWRTRQNPFFGYRLGDVGRDNKNLYVHPDDDSFGASDTWLGFRIVRAVSVLMGAATVWVIYRTGREIFPERPEMALGAAGLAGFIPEFLFISGAVNDDNGAALCGALALWAMMRLLREGPNLRRCAGLGLALGLGWLSKLTVAALLPTAGAVLALLALRNRSWRDLFRWGALVFGVAALLIVPWLIRQTVLYGDPTGTAREMSEWGLREQSVVLADLGPDLLWLRTSFWGRLGYNQIPLAGWIYVVLDVVTLLSILGLVRLTVRCRRLACPDPLLSRLRSPYAVRPLQMLTLAFAFLLTFGPMVVRRFLRPMPNFGRYLFPVLPAIALLMFTGLAAWLPPRRRSYGAIGVGLAMLVLGASGLVFFLAPAFARPPIYEAGAAPDPGHRLDWVFCEDDRPLARLVGYDLDHETVEPGQTLGVTLYWEPLAETQSNYVIFAQLFGRAGAGVGQRDTYPGLGHYPTSFWQPGEVVVDHVPIPLDPAAVGPTRLRLDVGLYDRQDGRRLEVVDAEGRSVPGATAGWLKLAYVGGVRQPAVSANYQFGESIALVGYDHHQDRESLRLVFHWASLAPLERDYTVFVHLMNPDGTLAAQADGPPIGGDYPTSLWGFGEIIADERVISKTQVPPGVYRLEVGWYLLETGERLPATDADGVRLPDDIVLLAEVEVR